jgi:hypothetical protein
MGGALFCEPTDARRLRAKRKKGTATMNELLAAIKDLVGNVCGYLDDFGGNDSDYIVAFRDGVDDILEKAGGIPEFREWIEAIAAQRASARQALEAAWRADEQRAAAKQASSVN